jgi:type II secretory pathway pseudopilin PulG
MHAGSARVRHGGFALVVVLAGLAIVSLGLAFLGPSWAHQAQRERERELMRVGVLYAHALASYRAASPGAQKHLPQRLEELLNDVRFAGTTRHLRRLYFDPLDPHRPLAEVRDASGGIVGVRSTSDATPLARGPVVLDDRTLPPAQRYSDWIFSALTPP